MRTRAVWADQFLLYGWNENHSAVVPLKASEREEVDIGWIEPRKRLHGNPMIAQKSRVLEPRRVTRFVNRRLFGWRFRMESMETWDLFDRMSRSRHSEWRDGVSGPYYSSADESLLLSRGKSVLPCWTDGNGSNTLAPWRSERNKRNRSWGPVCFIREVLSSRWWSDRMGVGSLLLVPCESFLPSKPTHCVSTVHLGSTFRNVLRREWCRDYRWRISLSEERTTPMGIALELLRERGGVHGETGLLVNRDRLRAFAVRFWGEERAESLGC